MVKFKDVMGIVDSNSIVLNHTAVGKTAYICNGWTKKDYQRLVEDFGEAEVMRVNFHTSYGNTPEIFLDPAFQPTKTKVVPFTSVWEGMEVRTKCSVNLGTKEITDVEPCPDETAEYIDRESLVLERQYVLIGGIEYPVVPKDELPDNPDAFWYD